MDIDLWAFLVQMSFWMEAIAHLVGDDGGDDVAADWRSDQCCSHQPSPVCRDMQSMIGQIQCDFATSRFYSPAKPTSWFARR